MLAKFFLFMTLYNQKVGAWGEKLACKMLIKKKYLILAQNVQIKSCEIDIIAKIKEIYVFIEVKTRTSRIYGGADAAITSKKIKNIKKAMQMYMNYKNISGDKVRLDLICIDIYRPEKIAKIKHYKEIF